MEVVETDLGEYIIQMEGETPSHIIVPRLPCRTTLPCVHKYIRFAFQGAKIVS